MKKLLLCISVLSIMSSMYAGDFDDQMRDYHAEQRHANTAGDYEYIPVFASSEKILGGCDLMTLKIGSFVDLFHSSIKKNGEIRFLDFRRPDESAPRHLNGDVSCSLNCNTDRHDQNLGRKLTQLVNEFNISPENSDYAAPRYIGHIVLPKETLASLGNETTIKELLEYCLVSQKIGDQKLPNNELFPQEEIFNALPALEKLPYSYEALSKKEAQKLLGELTTIAQQSRVFAEQYLDHEKMATLIYLAAKSDSGSDDVQEGLDAYTRAHRVNCMMASIRKPCNSSLEELAIQTQINHLVGAEIMKRNEIEKLADQEDPRTSFCNNLSPEQMAREEALYRERDRIAGEVQRFARLAHFNGGSFGNTGLQRAVGRSKIPKIHELPRS